MLTGESHPVFKTSGDPVYAGTHNQGGRLIIRATATGQGTALADIVRLIQRAEGHRARIQRLVDQITAIFTCGGVSGDLDLCRMVLGARKNAHLCPWS